MCRALIRSVVTAAAIFTSAAAIYPAHAVPVNVGSNYFVRPALRVAVDQNIIDGIEVNGATTKTMEQGAIGTSRSIVNFADGTVKMYQQGHAGNENLQTFGSFGERITIRGGAGTTWTPSFSVDGTLETYGGGPVVNGSTPPLWRYNVGLYVYRAGVADWTNFFGLATDDDPNNDPIIGLFDDNVDEINYQDDYDYVFAELSVSGMINLTSNNEVFDIFAFTNLIINTQTGDGLLKPLSAQRVASPIVTSKRRALSTFYRTKHICAESSRAD